MTPEEILRQKRIQLGINEEDFQRKYYSQTDQFDNQNDVGLINEIIGGAKELGRALIKTPVRLTQNVAAAGRILGGQSFEEATAPRYSRLLGEEITPVGTQDGGGLTWQNLKESAGAGLELSSFIPVSRGVQAGFRGAVGAAAREGAVGGGLASAGQQLSETGTINPLNVARDVAIGAGLGGVLGGTVAGVQGVSRATERASRSLGELLDEASQKTQGIQELGRGIGSRIQRGVQRGVDNLEQNAQIAQRARESTPAVANALRSRVDDDLINRIQSIDTPTLNITKRVIETAEDINKGSSNALEPIGEEAVKAFNLIDKERKSIGSRLGEAVNRLSKERNIESSTLYNSLDEKLRQVGISPTYDSKNPLNFPADFSEAERNAVNKLYREATKLGDNISARDIQRMDNLFSKLQRESKVIDQLGDIIVDVSDSEGNITRKNIFQLFRDTFSDELDTLSPEIRELNREYRKYRVLVDDLTDTIFRNTQNLDSLRDIVGTEEFVPNALRRAFSNAVTAPNYREMLRLLEDRARSLGYEGANLEQAGDLAIRLIRDYFPQGEQLAGLRSQTTISQNVPRSAIDVIGNVVNFGKLELSDVQKAIKEMIEERLSNFNPAETAIVSQVDDLVEQAKKYKSAEGFVNKADITKTQEFKKWAGKDEVVEVYHGSPNEFDTFKMGGETYNISGQPTSGVSFADKYSNAEPFSRQYSERYHKEYKQISDKFKKLYDESKKTGGNEDFSTILKKLGANSDKISSEDASVILRFRGKTELEQILTKDELNKLEELAFGNKEKLNALSKQREQEISKLDKKYANEGKVYRAYLKGKVVEVDGEDIGFGASRNELVDNLAPNEILKINNADTGQYIGTEYMTNNPDNIFIVNAGKTKSQLIDIWNKANKNNADDALIQEARKYKSAEEFVKAQFNKKPEYGMSHRPSWEGMPPAHNLLEGETLPRDVYTHPDYSLASGRIRAGDKAANESWNAILKIKGKPDADITVYRAGRANKLNVGDWVTFSKEYAKQSLEGPEKVYSFKVKAKDVLFAGDDVNEFGYYPKSQLTDIWNKANK